MTIVLRSQSPIVSYGPAGDDADGEFVLAVYDKDYQRHEIVLDERAMYELWTEVRGVPWPFPEHERRRDRLVRQLVHLANGATEEQLEATIEALRIAPEESQN